MLAKLLRHYFGGVRLFMTLLTALAGLAVVFADIYWRLALSGQIYGFLSALVGYMAVFVWKDTHRPAGMSAPAAYFPQDPAGTIDRIGGAD